MSNLDPVSGLAALKRRKKRKRDEGKRERCEEHNEEFLLFDLDDMELMCHLCAGKPNKVRHNIEALDVAENKLKVTLTNQLSIMEQKRSKLDTFVQTLTKDQEKLSDACESVQKSVREKFDALRKLLDEKEKEMEDAVKRMEQNKLSTIASELKKANQVQLLYSRLTLSSG